MTDAAPSEDFETALGRLEEIVKDLEGGDLTLDRALELFEEGVRLSRFCHGKLEHAERRVELLLADGADGIRAVPFEAGTEPVRNRE